MGMIKYLLGLLRSGPLTVSDPAQVTPPQRGNRGTPELDSQRCEVDGACQAACPTDAIKIEIDPVRPQKWSIDYGLCIFCGACIQACPEDAIISTSTFELATRPRRAVIVTHLLQARDA